MSPLTTISQRKGAKTMTHPTHHWIVKRDFGDKYGWGYMTDAEDAASFDDCVDAVIASFDGDDVALNAATLLVLEIDGGVAINRTEDVLNRLYIYTTWRGVSGKVGRFTSVCRSGSDTAIERGENEDAA
jgi:hypothetical protein